MSTCDHILFAEYYSQCLFSNKLPVCIQLHIISLSKNTKQNQLPFIVFVTTQSLLLCW